MRRIAIPAALALATGLTLVGTESPANADTTITATTITSPTGDTHYLFDDGRFGQSFFVEGTATDAHGGELMDVLCYRNPLQFEVIGQGAVNANGGFRITASTNPVHGTCVLRAVPSQGFAKVHETNFTGPRITVERHQPRTIFQEGPNKGKVIDYTIEYQGSKAYNSYASSDGPISSRLTYSDGFSSAHLWRGGAVLLSDLQSGETVRVDGRRAYGPSAAAGVNVLAPGLPELTYSTSRNPATGVTTIHETQPFVHCFADGCDNFERAGVQLERTIVTDDGGLQVHISDVWRSLDGRAHTLSLSYFTGMEGVGTDGIGVFTGLRFPWLQPRYQKLAADSVLPGTTEAPVTISVRDKVDAPDGDTEFPRGAVTTDTAPHQVPVRSFGSGFTLRDEGLVVPAGGTRVVRHDYVIGTTEAEIDAKAAASRIRLTPRRPDTLVRARRTYLGNGIYNTTGTTQTATLRKKRGKTARYSILVQNDGTLTDTFRLKGTGKKKGFAVKYLAGRKDVTRQIVRGTYTLKDLAPGAQRVLKLVIKVKPTAKKGKLRSWLLTSTSANDTTSTDTIAAAIKVKR